MRAAARHGPLAAHGVLCAALAAAAAIPPAPAAAQSQPGFDCNLYGPTAPCDPYLLYPPGQNLQFTIRSREAAGGSRPEGRINTLQELFAALGACWRPPAEARPGMQFTIRLSFKRDGNIFGQPKFTYIDRTTSAAERERYQQAVMESLSVCVPLPFTPGLGGAVAGRPLVIRYIDDRNTQPNRT